jgi:uncharacterized membrane protein
MSGGTVSWRRRSILFLLASLAFFLLTIFVSDREYSFADPGWSHGLRWDAALWLLLGILFLVLGAWKPKEQ